MVAPTLPERFTVPGVSSAIVRRITAHQRTSQSSSWIGLSTAKDRITVADHIEAVKEDRPLIAVAPDVTDERDGNSFEVADELAKYAENVIVVPKAMSARKVPSRFRVGIPCQKRFGQVPPRPIWEYQQCEEVHLLGGSPLVQSEIADKIGEYRVKSLDTASPIAAAQSGKVWGRPFKSTEWYDSPRRSYYERVEASLNNLLKYHNETINEERREEIRGRMSIPDEPTTDPLEYLRELPPSREEMCIGPNEEKPFPGREYFMQENALSYKEWRERNRPASV